MNPDSRPEHLTPERVEWVPSSPEQIEVRVSGAWNGPSVPPRTVLVVGALRIVGANEPSTPPAWAAVFHVPAEARAAVEAGEAALDVDGTLIALPAGGPGRIGGEEPEAEGGTLVDPAVLAERRARRAELAERSATDRAATAEQAAETLRVQLSHLEERLSRAAGERDALAARVVDAERRLRLAEQREEAERRRRSELEGEAAEARRLAEDELSELRERLASAVEVTEALERELHVARLRQEAAEAAATRVDARLREALGRVAELEAGTPSSAGEDAARQQVRALEARLAETEERLRREAAVLSDRLSRVEAERAALERQLAERPAPVADTGAVDELRSQLAEAESAQEALRARMDDTAAVSEALVRRATEAEAEVKRLRGGAEIAEAARARLEARVEEAEAAAAEARAQLDVTVAEAAELRRRLAAAPPVVEPGAPTEREQALVRQVATLQADLSARAATQSKVQQAIEVVRTELGEIRARVDAGRAGTTALRAQLAAAEARGDELEASLSEARATLADARVAITDAREEAAGLRAALEAERATRAALDARVRELTEEVEALKAAAAPEVGPAEVEEAPVSPPPSSPEPEAVAPAEPAPAPAAARPEPLPPTGDPAMDLLLAGLRDQIASAREQLAWDTVLPPREEELAADAEPGAPELTAGDPHRADDDTHRRLQEIERDLRASLPTPERTVPAREVITSLQEAAERLRAAAEAELTRIEEPEAPAAPSPEPVAATPEPEPAPVGEPEPVAAAPEPEPEPTPAPPTTSLPARSPAIKHETPWLRTAIERLATTDAKAAADVFTAALPAQERHGLDIAYTVSAPELGTVRVGGGPVAPPSQITGELTTLAPLAAGGAPSWRPARALTIEGDRRAVKKLLKAQRAPVTLAQLAATDPPPRALLLALAAAVDPTWTAGHRFGVTYEIAGAGDEVTSLTVVADDGRPLLVAGPDAPSHAKIALSAKTLHQLLAGSAEGVEVSGDARAAKALHAWFDRARGASAG